MLSMMGSKPVSMGAQVRWSAPVGFDLCRCLPYNRPKMAEVIRGKAETTSGLLVGPDCVIGAAELEGNTELRREGTEEHREELCEALCSSVGLRVLEEFAFVRLTHSGF